MEKITEFVYRKIAMERKEAIEVVKKNWPDSGYSQLTEALETLIPQLKESEDERILNCIRICLTDAYEQRFKDFNTSLKDCFAWLEKQGETFTKKDVDDAYLKGVCDTKQELEKQWEKGTNGNEREIPNSEQKSDWSEEDEEMWLSALEYIQTYPAHRNSVVDWLKELKHRVQPQPKQEWSEEDEYVYNEILKRVADKKLYEHDLEYIYKWLKSLKERVGKFDDGFKVGFSAAKYNHWKPSSEQMYILNWVANILLNHNGIVEEEASKKLQSLYNDLKKLMEE